MADDERQLDEVLRDSKTIAVVGIKADETEDAHRVPQYMQAAGYRIIPVNPKLDQILGETAYDRLAEIEEPIDLVNLFRAPENIPEHVREILALPNPPKAVWMQLGIYHGTAAAQLRAAGITVIQDRCIMVEHRRLLGTGAAHSEN
jgi:predicted CoA-binding protein